MSRIGQLITGAGVETPISGLSQVGNIITIGSVDTANPLTGFQMNVNGETFININNTAFLTAFMKYMMQGIDGADNFVGSALKVATGKLVGNIDFVFRNGGATTPIIYAASDQGNGIPLQASQETITQDSTSPFDKFTALFLTTPANVQRVDLTFADGNKDSFTIQDLDSLFCIDNQADLDGKLGTCTVIDNRKGNIKLAEVYTQTGPLTVGILKLPQQAFDILKKF